MESNPPGTNGVVSKTYNAGTLDEHTFQLSLSGGAGTLRQGDCLTAMSTILYCDLGVQPQQPTVGGQTPFKVPPNPMGWVQGGTYVQGSFHYSISIARTNRPWRK